MIGRNIGKQGSTLYALAWIAAELVKSAGDRVDARRERKDRR